MGNFASTIELLKKEREKQNVSLKELSKKLKIPIFVLKKLEEDEKYIEENYPYSILMLKSIAKELNIKNLNFEESKSTKEKNFEKIEENKNKARNFDKPLKDKFLSIFRIGSLSIIISIFIIISYSFKDKSKTEIPEYKLSSKNFEEDFNISYVSSPLVLVATNDIWISADIDGKKEVISLKKGQSKTIPFKNNIHFETIGNADSLTIIYNGKKVSFSNKVIHNIFVDAEGIFKDGYNLFKGRNS